MVNVIALGEILVDLVATEPAASLLDAPAFVPFPGGAPANVAVGVRRLGKTAAFVGKVGADDFGQGLRALLAREGVVTDYLLTDPNHLTTLAIAGMNATGEARFLFTAGAHAHLRPADLDAGMFADARILCCGSVALAHEPARAAVFHALDSARAVGCVCAFDVNWRPALWPDPAVGISLIRDVLRDVAICKMNLAELRLLTGEHDPHTALWALPTSAPLAVVTLGAEGCLARYSGAIIHVPAAPSARVVDSIGAGDAFMAALLTGLPDDLAALTEATLTALLGRAHRAAAISVSRAGGIPSLPYARELLD